MIASCVGTESDAPYWAHFRPGNHELRCSLLTPLAELFPLGDANALAPQPPTLQKNNIQSNIQFNIQVNVQVNIECNIQFKPKHGQQSQSSSQNTANEAKARAKKTGQRKNNSSQKTANDSKLRGPGERCHTIGRISARVTVSFAASFSRL